MAITLIHYKKVIINIYLISNKGSTIRSLFIVSLLFTAILYIDHAIAIEKIKEQARKSALKAKQTKVILQNKKDKKDKKDKIDKLKPLKKTSKKRYISQKKKKFFALVVPAIENVHKEEEAQFLRVKKVLDANLSNSEIVTLKKQYRVTTDKALLLALKPHPQSIVIAQAAIESAWGTSRFFREANNIFGMWSKNPNEPRIAAGVKRDGKRTIWLRKFNTLDASIQHYYRTIGRVKHYKEFRELRYKTDDVNLLVKKLDKYSELGDEYTRIVASVIRHNNLTQYDK